MPDAYVSGSPLGPQATITDATAFFESGNPPWIEIEWAQKLSPTLIARVVLFKSGLYGIIDAKCQDFASTGKLTGCVITDDPSDQGYREAGAKLMRNLTASNSFRETHSGKVKFIHIQMRLSNSDKDEMKGPCWPPSCIVEPGPPPPPPVR
ncbi:hypothetical protein [Caulobacter sp. S45]|uniref:hypothetical protein n=1 Tax=Caulobacter sp. S45 TaxID=1641861 RepID=UPI001576C68A|nr:hypothetical protein [Caulobacter sp. S45]